MILYLGDIKIVSHRRNKPLMKNEKGKKWVELQICINDKNIKCYVDEKFGNALYFEREKNIWHSIIMIGTYYHERNGVQHYSFNPLTEKMNFKTKSHENN